MIALSLEIEHKLSAARLGDHLALIQEECDQHGYLIHLTAILGSGSFGTVFLADLAGETVAMKVSVPRPGMEAVFVAICEEEGHKACALASLPHIAAGIEYWFADAAPLFFLASRYVHGLNLKAYQQRFPGPIDEGRLSAWALQLTEALAAMHQQGLVHRDVKPENILLEQATDQLYLTDLGVAKYAQLGTLEALRTTGTHPYAPREQILGSATYKSDQYALGIVLFELATGVSALPPTPAPQHGYPMARPPQLDPQRYNQALSAEFATCIERLAALKPGNRFPSMQAAHEALRRLHRLPARQRTEPMEPSTAPLQGAAPARATAHARPSFAWRPFWQLRQALLGGPIRRGGPALSAGGVVWLMVLYLVWLLATAWSAASTWAALSGHRLGGFWLLAGAAAIVGWRIARTWNISSVTRRGSLSARRRRALALWCLVGVVAAAIGGGLLLAGYPAPLWTTAWLECVYWWGMWLVLYLSLEIWLS